jgi:hypothetical protein
MATATSLIKMTAVTYLIKLTAVASLKNDNSSSLFKMTAVPSPQLLLLKNDHSCFSY